MWRRGWAAVAALLLAACATTPTLKTPSPEDWRTLNGARVILLGERHDGPQQENIQEQVVTHFIGSQQLQALVLEMADHPQHTRGLPPTANEAQVRAALNWSEAAWPWARYRGPIMAAVRARIPVLGGNLPHHEMAAAMTQASELERRHPEPWARLQSLVRDGHCGLLPEAQVPRMTRVQIAKDQRMAQTALQALADADQTGTVVVIAGAVHANKRLGLPLHLPPDVGVRAIHLMATGGEDAAPGEFDAVWLTPAAPNVDHCAQLRKQWSNHSRSGARPAN